jgi:hypothetical protein
VRENTKNYIKQKNVSDETFFGICNDELFVFMLSCMDSCLRRNNKGAYDFATR